MSVHPTRRFHLGDVNVSSLPSKRYVSEKMGASQLSQENGPKRLLASKPSSKASEQVSNMHALRSKELTFDRVVPTDTTMKMLTPQEIEDISVVEIKTKDTDPQIPSGLNSSMLGAQGSLACGTCGQNAFRCVGHYGHIRLAVPVIHPSFYKHVIAVMRCVCKCCGNLYLSDDKYEELGIEKLHGSEKLFALAEASKDLNMGHKCNRKKSKKAKICEPPKEYNMKDSTVRLEIVYTVDGKAGHYKPKEIEEFFQEISDKKELLHQLGFENGSPLGFIIRNVLVIPPSVRPYNYREGSGDVDEHYLTRQYKAILNKNEIISNLLKLDISHELSDSEEEEERRAAWEASECESRCQSTETNGSKKKRNKGRDEDIGKFDSEFCLLEKAIRGLIEPPEGNTYGQVASKTLKDQINGKEGILREEMMGKRVDVCGRSVLSGSGLLKFGEIFVPRQMTSVVTVPVKVTSMNEAQVRKWIQDGKVNRNINKDGYKIDKKDMLLKRLDIGDTVHRHLMDGDYVVFNRQPTLHKQSIMGYKVRIWENKTIGLHIAYTTPHNADYDGDEGNIHVPQTPEAIQEVKEIMNVRNCIMNGENNAPSMGVVYNSISAGFMLTRDTTRVSFDRFVKYTQYLEEPFDHDEFTERLSKQGSVVHMDKEGNPLYTGKQLFSILLPPDFYYHQNGVLIQGGVVMKGQIKKGNLGASSGSIIQHLNKFYPTDRVMQFYTEATFILNAWVEDHGLTIGIGDILPPSGIREDIDKVIFDSRQKINSILSEVKIDPLEKEQQEEQVKSVLSNIAKIGQDIAKKLDVNNMINAMALSGAKGSTFNIAQIIGLLGQQFLDGQRFQHNITGKTRCLPYFDKNSNNMEAKGFCGNSFYSGLNPSEFFFHQATGRVGLTNTAVKTRETGSIQHKMGKAMEDLKVSSDGSVRNGSGRILQFVYAGDGFDRSEMMKVDYSGDDVGTDFFDIANVANRLNQKYSI